MSYGEKVHVYNTYQKLLSGKLLEVSGKMRTGFRVEFRVWDSCTGEGRVVGTLGLPGVSRPSPEDQQQGWTTSLPAVKAFVDRRRLSAGGSESDLNASLLF